MTRKEFKPRSLTFRLASYGYTGAVFVVIFWLVATLHNDENPWFAMLTLGLLWTVAFGLMSELVYRRKLNASSNQTSR